MKSLLHYFYLVISLLDGRNCKVFSCSMLYLLMNTHSKKLKKIIKVQNVLWGVGTFFKYSKQKNCCIHVYQSNLPLFSFFLKTLILIYFHTICVLLTLVQWIYLLHVEILVIHVETRESMCLPSTPLIGHEFVHIVPSMQCLFTNRN